MGDFAREPEFNPYAAPKADWDEPPLADYYRNDSRLWTYREWWRMSPNLVMFAIAATMKTLGVPLARNHAIVYPHELTLVAWEDLGPHVRRKWAKRLAECDGAGFRRIFCYTLPRRGIAREVVHCILQTEDRRCTANLVYARVESRTVISEIARANIVSRLSDGRYAQTADSGAYLDPPEDRIMQRVLRKPIAEMRRRHLDWIAGIGATPMPRDPKELPQVALQREQEFIKRMAQRGVFVRISERELDQIERRGGGETPPEIANTPTYRFLRRAERVLFFSMLIASSWLLIAPGLHAGVYLLFAFGLCVGSIAGLVLVKCIQFLLKRSRASEG